MSQPFGVSAEAASFGPLAVHHGGSPKCQGVFGRVGLCSQDIVKWAPVTAAGKDAFQVKFPKDREPFLVVSESVRRTAS